MVDVALLLGGPSEERGISLNSARSVADHLEGGPLSEDELIDRLRTVDLVFPVMHGQFGEDGQVQALLERAGVPYVGTGAQACATAFDKYEAKRALDAHGI